MVRVHGRKGFAAASLLSFAFTSMAATAQDQTEAQAEWKPPRHIDGAKNPELLPEPIVWDNVFAALHDFMDDSADTPDRQPVDEFVRANLFISREDGRILQRGVQQARAAVQLEQDRLDEASRADRPQEEITELRRQVDKATLDGRDEILRSLSPGGAKALLRWVAVIKYGMSYGGDSR